MKNSITCCAIAIAIACYCPLFFVASFSTSVLHRLDISSYSRQHKKECRLTQTIPHTVYNDNDRDKLTRSRFQKRGVFSFIRDRRSSTSKDTTHSIESFQLYSSSILESQSCTDNLDSKQELAIPSVSGFESITSSPLLNTSFVITNRKIIRPESFTVPAIGNSTMKTLNRAAISSRKMNNSGSPAKKWSRNLVEGALEKKLHCWSVEPPENMHINSKPLGNVVGRLLRFGELGSDVKMTFNRLCFRNFRISGGGRLDASKVHMNTLRFIPPILGTVLGHMNFGPQTNGRFASAFEFYAQDCVMTNEDIQGSSCIKNGLENLLCRVFKRMNFVDSTELKVERVNISPKGKISCTGEATTIFGNKIPFTVRSRITVSSRGHVVEFPGLEVSVSQGLDMFIPVHPRISVDMGNNFKVEHISVSGKDRCLKFSAKALITPIPKMKLNYKQQKESFLADFHVDAAQWLTNIGNFAK